MDYKKVMEKYKDESLKELKGIININSVYDETTVDIKNNKPYGEGVYKALCFWKDLALKNGFNVDFCDGHALEIQYGDPSTRTIGVFAHTDVVPISGKWEDDPFSGVIKNNRMYGRGTSDDKGPAMASFYALKALKENGLIKGYNVKLVLGGDEERGSSCLEYYFHKLHKKDVDYGFTPDGDFPLIFGEKGISNYVVGGKTSLKNIISMKAGLAPNIVIDSMVVTLKDYEPLLKYLAEHKEIKYEIVKQEKDMLTINFIGKAAHGSTPELGNNSAVIAFKVLGEVYDIKTLKMLGKQYSDYNGKTLNEYFVTKNMGVTTYNVGMVDYKDKVFKMVVNFRYPENVDAKKVCDEINEISPLPIKLLGSSPVLYFDPETPFIKKLYDVYVRETKDTLNKPMTIGGGTYAKEAKNIVAFGSKFPGKVDYIHEANEKIDLEDFFNSMPIYMDAIYTLGTFIDED
ncbi:MAG: Sapep family Mn(2+)-dependent dipeptidase [Bacilli bacterium]